MEAFHFRLEKVLQYRTKLAEECEQRLAAKAQQCNALRYRIEEHRQNQINSRLKYGVSHDLEERQLASAYDERLSAQIKVFHDELAIREQERLFLQKEYTEKLKDQKILDKLKENQKKAWKLRKLRHDEKNIDDIISSRYSGE